jgi:SfnB family sulfur acquisition oxidoreductase
MIARVKPSSAPILSSDHEALEIAAHLAKRFAPGAAERDALRRLPFEEIEEYSASGLWGITVPKEYGGPELPTATLIEVMARICAADSSIGQIPQNHFAAVEAIRLVASPEQKSFLFGEALKGKRLGNAAAELGGAAVGALATRLTKSGADFVLTGRKFYSTGALFADWIPVIALDDEDRKIMAFVPRDADGLNVIDDWSGFGQRTTGSGTTVLDRVHVPGELVIPYYQAYEQPTNIGSFAQALHAAIFVGIARAAIKDTIEFVRGRTRPWADAGVQHGYEDPLLIQEFGKVRVQQSAAEALLFRAADLIDRSNAKLTAENTAQASIAVAEAKTLATEAVLLAANKLFELAGTSATLEKHSLDRHWRNARTHTLHDPVRWKYQLIGDYYLNGTPPPKRSYV